MTNPETTDATLPELTITRLFDAPPELLYKLWTDGEHLKHWCCPKGFSLPFSEGDIREGGKYRSCMRAPDGQDYWLRGTYRELVPNERVVFTHVWEENEGRPGHETLVTVTFEARQGKTLLTLHQAFFPNAASRDGHAQGWEETLDHLEAYYDLQR